MNIPAPAHVLRFGVFELDSTSGELRRHGLKIRLPDQSFQILKTLLRNPGEVVTRDELRQVLWGSETFVGFEVGLNSAIRKLREALDDSAEHPRFVETLPRHGYRFIAPVSAPEAALRPEPVAEQAVDRVPEVIVTTTPRSPIGMWRAAGLLLVPVMIAAGVVYARGGFSASPAGAAGERIDSVVVLPFENLTGDATQDYLADSVADAVTVHLAQVDGLSVISWTSARQYKQTAKRLPDIGRELKVDGVVAGTVARSAAGVSITVRLHRAATDGHLWSQTYQGDLSHMMMLQRRIASEIAVAAGRPASQTSTGRATGVNHEAYDNYLKGLTAMGIQRAEGFGRAVAYFDEAVAIQPDFAEAHAALAQAQLQLLFGGPLSPHQVIPKAEAAARRALDLDDTNARAHWALGQILSLYYWRWADGDRELQRGVELQQGSRDNFSTAISASLHRLGRFEEAIATTERARKLDPLSVPAQIAVAAAYRAAGHHDRALEELRQAHQMSPAHTRVHFQLGVTFVAMGRLHEAVRELEIAARPAQGHSSRVEAYLGYAYAAAGRNDDARAVLKELETHRREQYVSWFGIALIHDALGEKEPALAALQRSYEDRAVEFALGHYPSFKAIAAEPGFQAVMRRVGLPR